MKQKKNMYSKRQLQQNASPRTYRAGKIIAWIKGQTVNKNQLCIEF